MLFALKVIATWMVGAFTLRACFTSCTLGWESHVRGGRVSLEEQEHQATKPCVAWEICGTLLMLWARSVVHLVVVVFYLRLGRNNPSL